MISVITVTHNSYELLEQYVKTFLEHHEKVNPKPDIELIFVENSGDVRIEEYASALRKSGFQCSVKMTANRGFGAGCNEGAKMANGSLLVFANPDILFCSNVSPIQDRFSGPHWGTIRQRNGRMKVHAFDLLPEYRSVLSEVLRVYRFAHKFSWLRRLSYPIGSFFVVSKTLFSQVGGFDERFFLYYEEAELSRRLHHAAGLPLYEDATSITHEGFGTQESGDFTIKQEAIGLVTYGDVVGLPTLAEKRLRILKMLGLFFPHAASRAMALSEHLNRNVDNSLRRSGKL